METTRQAALGGPAFFLLTMTGIFLVPAPDLGAAVGEERTWLRDVDLGRLDLATGVGVLGLGALLVFGLAVLAQVRSDPPGAASGTAATLLGVTVCLHLAAYGTVLAVGVRHADTPASTAALVNDVGMTLHWVAEAAYGGFLGAVGVLGLRTGGLPRWLSGVALLTAVAVLGALPFATHDWVHLPATAGGLWTVVTGLVLATRRPGRGRTGAVETVAAT